MAKQKFKLLGSEQYGENGSCRSWCNAKLGQSEIKPCLLTPSQLSNLKIQDYLLYLTLTVLGGGLGGPPLDIFGDCAATAWNFELSFHDFFPSSLTHILIPFSSKSDIPVRRYITISMRMSSKKQKKITNRIKICINYHY